MKNLIILVLILIPTVVAPLGVAYSLKTGFNPIMIFQIEAVVLPIIGGIFLIVHKVKSKH